MALPVEFVNSAVTFSYNGTVEFVDSTLRYTGVASYTGFINGVVRFIYERRSEIYKCRCGACRFHCEIYMAE